jgi:hypothetical protein
MEMLRDHTFLAEQEGCRHAHRLDRRIDAAGRDQRHALSKRDGAKVGPFCGGLG